jgi:hypothetical protein
MNHFGKKEEEEQDLQSQNVSAKPGVNIVFICQLLSDRLSCTMLRLVPVVQQHLRVPASALVSALPRPCRTHNTAQDAPVAAAAWQGVSNRSPLGLAPAATYSSGAGSSDAVPPSNLPSEQLVQQSSSA